MESTGARVEGLAPPPGLFPLRRLTPDLMPGLVPHPRMGALEAVQLRFPPHDGALPFMHRDCPRLNWVQVAASQASGSGVPLPVAWRQRTPNHSPCFSPGRVAGVADNRVVLPRTAILMA